MAGRTRWGYSQDQGILIAIDQYLFNPKQVSRRLTLLPQGLARPGIEVRNAGILRCFQRFDVHECQHENLASVGMNCNSAQQAIAIKFRHE